MSGAPSLITRSHLLPALTYSNLWRLQGSGLMFRFWWYLRWCGARCRSAQCPANPQIQSWTLTLCHQARRILFLPAFCGILDSSCQGLHRDRSLCPLIRRCGRSGQSAIACRRNELGSIITWPSDSRYPKLEWERQLTCLEYWLSFVTLLSLVNFPIELLSTNKSILLQSFHHLFPLICPPFCPPLCLPLWPPLCPPLWPPLWFPLYFWTSLCPTSLPFAASFWIFLLFWSLSIFRLSCIANSAT